jgi:NTP pyrophosphatase (non-canonical NTP hydrolase)
MDFNEYQKQTATTAIYPGQGSVTGLLYCGLGLGEAGEVQGKAKKVLRDDDGVLTDEKRDAMRAELGDLLWYVAQFATELGVDLSDVAEQNLQKLAGRAARGALKGSGDER